jgi:hypothetical protein
MVCLINRWDDFTFVLVLLKHATTMQHKKGQILFSCYIMEGVRVDTVSLKAGRLRVSFPKMSLGIFIDLIVPATL